MAKELIIFEYTDEVKAFITQRSFDELKSDSTHIIAIQPGAQAYLRRRGIPHHNTVRFFSKESHQNLVLKSAEIIEAFRRLFNIEDCLGNKEGYNNAFIFYLRHYSILYLLWLIEITNNAIEELKPEKLIAIKLDFSFDIMNQIPGNERHISMIVEKLAQHKGLQAELTTGRRKQTNPIIEKVKTSLLEILKIVIFKVNMIFFSYKSRDKKYILYSSDSYNLKKVIKSFIGKYDRLMSVLLHSNHKEEDLKRMFCDDTHWSMLSCLPAHLPGNKRSAFLQELKCVTTRLKEYFSNNRIILEYKGVEFHELVFSKIEKRMIPFLLTLYGQAYSLDKILMYRKPSLVLSQMSRGFSYILGELASIYNIPSVLISHGSHVSTSNRYADMEWAEHSFGLMNTHYKYVAIQSPWALSSLRDKRSGCIPIKTGPLLFSKIDRGEILKLSIKKKIIPQHCSKIIILHAGSPKSGLALRPYVFETVDEYIENINSLIEVVDKLEEVHLIVRFRPSDFLKLNDFLELLIKSGCYSVHSDGTFEDYLTISDLLVSYSSTTIEEALQNRIPVLQYDSQGKYCHIKDAQVLDPALNINVESCYLVDSEKKLEWGLNWLIENHLKKDNVSGALWERHSFRGGEIVNLPSFFSNLFMDKTS